MTSKIVKPLLRDTYLAVINNSVGTAMFRNFYAEVDGVRSDIMRDGDLSCAFYVSAVLKMFGYISRLHGTVDGAVEDMRTSGWVDTKEPKPGDVIVWEKKKFDNGEEHNHMGFYLGENKAISNSDRERVPVIHEFEPGRKVEAILTHPAV